ncbi:MAG: hypothetical protein GXO47_08620 [Chlorobi bacterium]|nr:hypothetical protein [Chlorobiota bacterium]
MKIKRTIGISLLVMLIAFGFEGCKSKQKVSAKDAVGKMMDDLPCTKEGRSDKKYFRASSMATSTDLQLSKEKALLLAKQRLVTLIKSTTKSVTDRYINERGFSNVSEVESKFENITREVANETLSNVVVVCEKSSVLDDGRYNSFIAIEVNRDDVLTGMEQRLSNDKKLQVDYDKKKFEEIFNEEMEKMKEERGY